MEGKANSVLNKEQFNTAYRRGLQRTIGLLLSRGLKFEDAEEYAQAAWARGWERRSQLRDPSAILPWVNSIALNTMKSSVVQARRQVPISPELTCGAGLNLAALDADSLMAQCRDCDRCILEDYYLKERSTSEIARRLRIAKASVRVRLLRARNCLREVVRSRGGMTGRGRRGACATTATL